MQRGGGLAPVNAQGESQASPIADSKEKAMAATRIVDERTGCDHDYWRYCPAHGYWSRMPTQAELDRMAEVWQSEN